MGRRRSRLVGCAKTNDRLHNDQCRAVGVPLKRCQGACHGIQIIGVADFHDLPTEPAKSRRDVFAKGQLRAPFDRDLVVVVDPTQVVEFQVSCQRSRFACHAFHQVAVAALDINVVVEQIKARSVVTSSQPFASDGHADAIAAALSKRTGRRFDARSVPMLGMAGRGAAPLSKTL